MSVRKATPEETRAIFGRGLIMPGRKPVPSPNANSTKQGQSVASNPMPILPDAPDQSDIEKDSTSVAKASSSPKR